jgi:hypothetical protein
MSWRYFQSTGNLFDPAGAIECVGYSGHGEGLNNPAFQNVPCVGPLPQGAYSIGEPFDDPEHGRYCLRLEPLEGTETFGRTGFLCHGDKISAPGQHKASLGCLIADLIARNRMGTSSDRVLEVLE